MTNLKAYTLTIPEGASIDHQQIKAIIERNASLFNDFILSEYGGDARYSVFDESFKVTALADDFFEFTVQVQFFAGCADQNDVFDVDKNVDYEIEENQLSFELDETVWRTE